MLIIAGASWQVRNCPVSNNSIFSEISLLRKQWQLMNVPTENQEHIQMLSVKAMIKTMTSQQRSGFLLQVCVPNKPGRKPKPQNNWGRKEYLVSLSPTPAKTGLSDQTVQSCVPVSLKQLQGQNIITSLCTLFQYLTTMVLKKTYSNYGSLTHQWVRNIESHNEKQILSFIVQYKQN